MFIVLLLTIFFSIVVEYDQFFEVSASLLHLVESNPENAVDAIKHLVVESSMHVFARVIATSYQYPERGGLASCHKLALTWSCLFLS